jgi:hypothetical protein
LSIDDAVTRSWDKTFPLGRFEIFTGLLKVLGTYSQTLNTDILEAACELVETKSFAANVGFSCWRVSVLPQLFQ